MAKTNREEDILLAAIKLFSEKGYSSTATSEIAKEAQVAEGTIFRYYKTKKDILLSVVDRVVENFANEQVIKRAEHILIEGRQLEPRETLLRLCYDRIEIFMENVEMLKIVIVEALYNDELRVIMFTILRNRMIPLMAALFVDWEQRGYIRKLEPEETMVAVRSFLALLFTHILQRCLQKAEGGFDAGKDLEIIVDIYLHGLRKESST